METSDSELKKFTANYTVEAKPMTVGDYCRRHWTTYLSDEKQQEPGFFVRYPFIDINTGDWCIGWMSEPLFNHLFRDAEI